MSDSSKQTTPLHVILKVIVVFGAPGTGKTTLLRTLAVDNDPDVLFATIEEPTSDPEIVAELEKMYHESADVIIAGESIAFQVQVKIMKRRAAMYREFFETKLSNLLEAATASGKKELVVVCDGHMRTDDKLYVQTKVELLQITALQQTLYSTLLKKEFETVPLIFQHPLVFVELTFSDRTGETNVQRIKARDSIAERNVDPSVFALIGSASRQALQTLRTQYSHASRICADLPPERIVQLFKIIAHHRENVRWPLLNEKVNLPLINPVIYDRSTVKTPQGKPKQSTAMTAPTTTTATTLTITLL